MEDQELKIVITVESFNPDLTGKAVHVKGTRANGVIINAVSLVRCVETECISFTNSLGNEFTVYLKDLYSPKSPKGITIKVLG